MPLQQYLAQDRPHVRDTCATQGDCISMSLTAFEIAYL